MLVKSGTSGQGSLPDGPNRPGALIDPAFGDYTKLKRRIYLRSLIFAFPLAVALAVRGPFLGLDFALGVVWGVANMMLMTRANERLLAGQATVGAHAFGSVMRVFAAGAVPIFVAPFVPWWGFGVYFGGFFLPLALYALELRRSYRQLS